MDRLRHAAEARRKNAEMPVGLHRRKSWVSARIFSLNKPEFHATVIRLFDDRSYCVVFFWVPNSSRLGELWRIGGGFARQLPFYMLSILMLTVCLNSWCSDLKG